MKFWWGLLIGIILGVVGALGPGLLKKTSIGSKGLVVTFTEAEIQERLEGKFPKSEKLLEIFPVEIGVPTVRFLDDSDRVELTMNAGVSVPFVQTYEAKGIFTTTIRYEQKDQTLRLSEVTVEGVEATNLPKKYEDPLRVTMTLAARKYLEDYPVHTLKQKDVKDELVRMFLKDLKVRNGRLEVTLGL